MSKKQLKNGLEKIEMIINDACQILEHLNLPSIANSNGRQNFPANSRSAVTTGAPPLKVFGRDKERDKVIAMLHKKERDGQQNSKSDIPYSVLGIHGIAGSGKSTLAQVVYAREKKDKQENKAGHFDLVMWVHVSQKFDLDVIFRELMEGATGDPCPTFNSRNTLQEKLEEKLHGKRTFLVLDDVWYNSRDEELQQILSPLKFWETGSKILVTSRSKDALSVLGSVEERCIPIPGLDDEAFFEMFMHYALGDATIEDDHDRAKLEMLGEDIAKKLKRSPLAARTVGAQLCLRPNVEFWRRTKDRAYDLNKLLWSAVLLTHHPVLENVESKEEAIEASLANKEGLTTLVLRWGHDTSCSPEEVEAEVLEGLCPSKYLERLEIRDYHGSTYPNWMVGKQNGGPKKLHNLWLDNCTRLEPAPRLFDVFIHLRWFRLWRSNWPALPDNIGQLMSLQELDIRWCSNIRSLPALPRSLERFFLCLCDEEFMRSCETEENPNWQKIQHIPKKFIIY